MRAVLGMCAHLLLTLLALGACDAGAKPEPRATPPRIVVRGSEITFQGMASNAAARRQLEAQGAKCEATPTGDLYCVYPDEPIPCEWVIEKVPSIAFAYDPKYFALATTVLPALTASCTDDAWPDELKLCIMTSSPQELAHKHACEHLVTAELRGKVAKRFGISPDEMPSLR